LINFNTDVAQGILGRKDLFDSDTEEVYVFYFFFICLRDSLMTTVDPAIDYFMQKWLLLEQENPGEFEMLEWMEHLSMSSTIRDYYSTLSTEWRPRFPDPVVPTVDDMYEMIQARPDFRASIDECPSSSSYYVP
jgi:hypothetical protein